MTFCSSGRARHLIWKHSYRFWTTIVWISNWHVNMDFRTWNFSMFYSMWVVMGFFKPIYTGNRLQQTKSCHPRSLIRNIPVGQYLRAKHICSTKENFEKHARDLDTRFTTRGYPRRVIDNATYHARGANRNINMATNVGTCCKMMKSWVNISASPPQSPSRGPPIWRTNSYEAILLAIRLRPSRGSHAPSGAAVPSVHAFHALMLKILMNFGIPRRREDLKSPILSTVAL